MNSFTIRDLEKLSGIKAHTIRVWEMRYSFLKPRRTDTNIRVYSNQELKTILDVALLNKYGYKISHINRMDGAEICNRLSGLSQLEAQRDVAVNRLIHLMVDSNIDLFEDAINRHIAEKGIEKTIAQLIFPFLEKIGLLWLTGQTNPAQSYLISNIIRQKLILGIESAINGTMPVSKTFILFLPEGHYHELGILYLHYLLKGRGIKTLYLGANVPVKDLEYVVSLKSPDYIYTHLTTHNHFNLDRFLQKLHTAVPDVPVLVSGHLVENYKKEPPPNIGFKKSLNEVVDFLSTI